MSDIVTLTETKLYLNIPTGDTTQDTELGGFISAATPVVEDLVGPVVPRQFDEWYDGGQSWIFLRHIPIADATVDVTAVTEFSGSTGVVLTEVNEPAPSGASYRYNDGMIYRIGCRFSAGFANIHVVYTAGRNPTPANIKQGALEIIRHNYQLSQQGGRPAFGGAADDVIFTPSGFAVPTRAYEWLAPHRHEPLVG